jgi:tyrosyl-tRNA synthetase
MKYLAKIADAEINWQEKASRIKAGQEKSMFTILEERGLIHTVTGYVTCCIAYRVVFSDLFV